MKTEKVKLPRLKEMWLSKNLTQQQVAEYLHIEQNTYSKYERGDRHIPVDLLATLALYYETSVDYLCDLTDQLTSHR